MPPLFRTLGPVGIPTGPFDPVPKVYADQPPDPQVLTYFRLGELQFANAASPITYALRADVGLGDLSISLSFLSRAPFPMRIIRFGLSYQNYQVGTYGNTLSAPYVMSLARYNPSTITPPFVIVGTGTLPAGQQYLDVQNQEIILGTGPNDVYQWNFATEGTSQNAGTINFMPWYEFVPIAPADLEQLQLQDNERVEKLNQELKDKQWYKDLMKELKNQLKDNKTNATKRPSNT